MLPRLQLFEFNDAPWAPELLKQTLIEALSRAIRWGHLMDGLVEPLAECLRAAGTARVLDLCAGAGGPAVVLAEAMARRGHDAHFLMTDLQPQVAQWEAACAEASGRLDFVRESVDATQIPAALGESRVRLIVNALHHFPPALAREVLRGACAGAPGVFVAENLVRNPMSFAAMAPVGIAALLAGPVLARDRRLQRALLAWFSPVALAVSAWDGTVSAFRIYEREELLEMVADLPGWSWSTGTYPHSSGFGRGLWLSGTRR